MVVGSVNSNMGTGAIQMPMQQGMDAYSKNIQNRIANAGKQMQELGENKELSLEEKMKRRQEIQQQINDLQNELRRHQIEQRKEKQPKSSSSADDMFGGSDQSAGSSKGTGMSTASMQAIISADSSMKQVKAQGAAKTQMDDRASVLKAEIKLDSGRGGNVDKKMEELSEAESKARDLENNQMSTIADINKQLKEASRTDKDDPAKNVEHKSDVTDPDKEIEATGEEKEDMDHTPVDIISSGITTSTRIVEAEGKEVDLKL